MQLISILQNKTQKNRLAHFKEMRAIRFGFRAMEAVQESFSGFSMTVREVAQSEEAGLNVIQCRMHARLAHVPSGAFTYSSESL